MREIKYRGKRDDNGEWVYGTYHYCVGPGTMRLTHWKDGNREIINNPVQFNCHWILVRRMPSDTGWGVDDTFSAHKIIPGTEGQFTGLQDKNGKDIYEGDVLEECPDHKSRFEVVWQQQYAKFRLDCTRVCGHVQYPEWNRGIKMTIIGNIYEHPQLLTH